MLEKIIYATGLCIILSILLTPKHVKPLNILRMHTKMYKKLYRVFLLQMKLCLASFSCATDQKTHNVIPQDGEPGALILFHLN